MKTIKKKEMIVSNKESNDLCSLKCVMID